MLKSTLLLVAGLVAGLAIAFWLQPSPEPSVEALAVQVDQRATFEALESPVRAPRVRENASNRLAPGLPEFIDRGRRAAAAPPGRLVIDLIVAGFAPDRAGWIDRRTRELRMQAMQAQYEARREGRPLPPDLEATTLRTELGDADYERFLIAQDRPTRIRIMSVLARSPAERAGLQQGDEIFAYDGARVFDIQQLNALALDGTSGQSVVVDVRRNGQNFGVALPKGPIGILSGGELRGPMPGAQR
jgi:hypothetical protein